MVPFRDHIAMNMPEYVRQALAMLEDAGFEAFAVGGCVRDSILGRTPNDWDICTAALPEETGAVFAGYRTIDTGMKHGTCTVLMDGEPLEITTYRIDGNYSDGRHPDRVWFSRDLREDLARRDFTVNAMAVDRKGRLVDPFGGRADLAAQLIRAVGKPEDRFREDALRIIRALRFAAVLGFRIEEETADAVRSMAALCRGTSRERIFIELTKLLMGDSAAAVLTEYRGSMCSCLGMEIAEPERLGLLRRAPRDLPLRCGIFFGPGAGRVRNGLKELKADNELIRAAEKAAELSEDPAIRGVLENDAARMRLLRDHGPEDLCRGIRLRSLLSESQSEIDDRIEDNRVSADEWENGCRAVERILERKDACWNRSQLAVNGGDILRIGVPRGPEVGRILDGLLEDVISGRVPNDRERLLRRIR